MPHITPSLAGAPQMPSPMYVGKATGSQNPGRVRTHVRLLRDATADSKTFPAGTQGVVIARRSGNKPGDPDQILVKFKGRGWPLMLTVKDVEVVG